MKIKFLHPIHRFLRCLPTLVLSTGIAVSLTQTASATPFLRTGTFYPDVLEDERIVCSNQNTVGALPVSQCREVARDFYRELYFQVKNFTPTAAFEVIQPTSIEFLTDGSGFTKGLFEAIPGYVGLTGGNPFNISIENAFIYQPLDDKHVVFFGAPLFTNFGISPDQKAYITNIQMTLYRRIHGDAFDPTCRSAQNPGGNLCWAIMAELWAYRSPLGFGLALSDAPIPSTPQPNTLLRSDDFPVVLEPERIICDSQIAAAEVNDPAWVQTCKTVAQEFYAQFRLDMKNMTAAGMFDMPASVLMIPDGSGYVGGVQTKSLYSDIVDGHTKIIDVRNAFSYKPTDRDTILVLGAPLLTIAKEDGSDVRFFHNAQLSVYKRTLEGLHSPQDCRSDSNPLGNVCWKLMNKLWIPQQVLGAGVSSTP